MVIAALSVWPFSAETARVIGPLDKLLHLCEYALFAWCLIQAMFTPPLRAGQAPARPGLPLLATAFLISGCYGALLEAVQGWLPYRRAEGWDLLANAAGAGLGALIARLRHSPAPPS